ncbi:uncharacterized protein [Dysidea avara]|uniref:uncharacterized protein isoform X2 n=1 Tax=Dysidea avara TaxID=196820 RepID=UPI00333365A1
MIDLKYLFVCIPLVLCYDAGTNVQLWTCDGGPRQQWVMDSQSQEIKLKSDGSCLDISNWSKDNGANIYIWGCHPDDQPQNQQWSYNSTTYTITSKLNDKCVDGSAYGTSDGTNIQQWECTGADNQKWMYNSTDGTFHYGMDPTKCMDAGSSVTPCQGASVEKLPFCDTTLDVAVRAKDLISRLQLSEKISQLATGSAGVVRLSVPPYQWWSEALHGVAGSPAVRFNGQIPNATSFPQVINLGATFDMPLIYEMGKVISTEARAMYNQGQAGLSFFAPNINLFRDPRWSRGQETPGEDPYLISQYVINFAHGMQAIDANKFMKTVVTCKHFAAYDLENWNGTDRVHFNAIVSDQDLVETYLPAFEACVREGNAGSIMCSYNAVNGVPSCANSFLQNTIVREQWGFEGYIVSDCGAIGTIINTHHYTSNPADTVAAGLHGGCDLDCGSYYPQHAQEAIDNKTITEADIDVALTRLFTYRLRLGLFDPANDTSYHSLSPADVNTADSQNLALKLAQESIVLLQNNKSVLPLDPKLSVAVLGPNSDATTTMQGNYYVKGTAPFLISPIDGIKSMASNVTTAKGCDVKCTDDSGFKEAVTAAQNAQAVIVVVGLDQSQESEGHDRNDISLPGKQEDFLMAIRSATKNPMIVVVMSGGPVDISWAKTKADAVLWCGYPGQSGGKAISQVIYGDVNPSGRLPYTIYPKDYVNQISFFDMGMRSKPGRTYKFYTGDAVYPFGYGLSYTTFNFSWSEWEKLPKFQMLDELSSVQYQVSVTNTGSRSGAIAVLAYMTYSDVNAPMKQLFGFQRVELNPKENTTIFFDAGVETFMTVDKGGNKVLKPGSYTVKIEDLSHTITLV